MKSHLAIPSLPREAQVLPLCPYFGTCGGCQMQHIPYEKQLEAKQKWLKELFSPWEKNLSLSPLIPSPRIWNYRRRIQVKVNPRGELGFFAVGSHQVVPIESCSIAEVLLNEALPRARAMAKKALSEPGRQSLLGFEITLQESGEVEIHREGEGRVFLQVNEGANQKLREVLGELWEKLKPNSVLELFAGSGNLTLQLATGVSRWRAVEENPEAVATGRAATGTMEIQWVQGEAGRELKNCLRNKESWDLVLLDPPRGGASQCISSLLKIKPRWVVYVSCHPPSLRRDAEKLTQGGYNFSKLQGFDFFPHSSHLESLAIFTRTSNKWSAEH